MVWGHGVMVRGNTGSGGKHEIWWKTRGLVENTGSGGKHGVSVENTGSKCKTLGTIFSPNYEVEILIFQIAMKINRRETRFFASRSKLARL